MADLSFGDFAVGEQWEMGLGERFLPTELIDVSLLPDSGRPGGAFRLEFRGPFDPLLPQGTYVFRRNGAAHDIFVCPIGREEAGTRYEAIFY
ncbi:MAG TPA: hypothetical protein VF552_04370 [Allosphingosinicella sp.]|jgi:hypothetical protein